MLDGVTEKEKYDQVPFVNPQVNQFTSCWGRCIKPQKCKKGISYCLGVGLVTVSGYAVQVVDKKVVNGSTENDRVISSLFAAFLILLGVCGVCIIGCTCRSKSENSNDDSCVKAVVKGTANGASLWIFR